MSKIKKVFLALVAIMVIIIAGFLIYINLNSGDIAVPDDSDLSMNFEEIPKEQNAYYDLLSASEKLYWPEEKRNVLDKMTKGEEWDEALAKEILVKNKEALSFFSKASQLSQFQDPAFLKAENFIADAEPSVSYSSLASLSKLKSLETKNFIKSKDFDKAGLSALDNIKVGYLLENSQDLTIYHLIGMQSKKTGINDLNDALEKGKLSKNNIKFLIDNLEKTKVDTMGVMRKIFKFEYQFIKTGLDNIFANNIDMDRDVSLALSLSKSSNFYYKPNETKKLFIDNYWKNLNELSDDCNVSIDVQEEEIENISIARLIFTENVVGKLLFNIVKTPSFVSLQEKLCKENAEIDNIIVNLKNNNK